MPHATLESSDALSADVEDRLPGPISVDLPDAPPVHDAWALDDDGAEPPATESVSRERRRAVAEARVTLDWSLGPVGRRRSVALGVLVGCLTLGLSAAFWFGRMTREMREFDARMVVRSGRTVLAMVLPWLLAGGLTAAEVARIVADHLGHSVDLPVTAWASRPLIAAIAVAPLLTVLLPMSAVALVMSAERLRVVEDRVGLAPHLQQRPVAIVRWAWLPVVGTVIAAAGLQRRLNEVWRIARP